MARNGLVLLLLVVTIVLGSALVRVESERYALWLGMCPNMHEMLAAIAANNQDALSKCTVQTRTAWWWHLYYATTNKG